MKYKKFVALIMILCIGFSIFGITFFVYAATKVDYTLSGSINYEAPLSKLKVEMNVYRSLSTNTLDENTHKVNLQMLSNFSENSEEISQNFKIMEGENYHDTQSTYDPVAGTNIHYKDNKMTKSGIKFKFGEPNDETQTAYAFYLVIDVTNYDDEIVNVKVLNKTLNYENLNILFNQSVDFPIEIDASQDGVYGMRTIVIGFALKDENISIPQNDGFNYDLVFEVGELEKKSNIIPILNDKVEITRVLVNDTQVNFEQSKITFYKYTLLPHEELKVNITMKSIGEVSSSYYKFVMNFPTIDDSMLVNMESFYLKNDTNERNFTVTFYNDSEQMIDLENVTTTLTYEEVDNLLQKEDNNTPDDESDDYYYVEMGTYMGNFKTQYLRWKYLSSDYTYSQPTGPNEQNLEDLSGIYVLDTVDELLKGKIFDASSNSYRESAIRKYLNYTNGQVIATGTLQEASNMCKDLNINVENDVIYPLIAARTVESLYSNMKNDSGDSLVYSQDVITDTKGNEISDTEFDKFWIMSSYEATMLITEQYRGWESAYCSYWLRTPTEYTTNAVNSVTYSGDITLYSDVSSENLIIRPMFQI